ncbi:MAG: O-antigen ligase family protein [Vicinamibacterales bacterium]|jgi:O-antigen ligase|nr:O-antigen ligase family protein [Vicinamibacterales bacterium]HJN43249.1 O-antigen ligase family protein [Vicinamibacterales bacterium]
MSILPDATDDTSKLEVAALISLLGFVAALQISIAASGILLTITLGLWIGLLVAEHERPSAPPFFGALVVYAAMTMVSVAFSLDRGISIVDSKEVLLFLVVPLVYRLARGTQARTLATIAITVGAASAVFGVVQFGILEYDNLGQRVRGTMGHYMTYSGLLVLVIALAGGRLLFDTRDRIWSALVMPALLVALALTWTRGAWVGACAVLGLLFVMKDLRLMAVLPVLAALFLAFAPPQLTDRMYSAFDLQDPTNRDRVAMARAGFRMISDRPLTGVGPDVVKEVYPEYRDASAVEDTNPHLHNVPLHIAAERGLPALAVWLGFLALLVRDLISRLKTPATAALAAAGLAAVAGMLTAGMFEYNFGDSEFLMLFLVMITLPFAAAASTHTAESTSAPPGAGR